MIVQDELDKYHDQSESWLHQRHQHLQHHQHEAEAEVEVVEDEDDIEYNQHQTTIAEQSSLSEQE